MFIFKHAIFLCENHKKIFYELKICFYKIKKQIRKNNAKIYMVNKRGEKIVK